MKKIFLLLLVLVIGLGPICCRGENPKGSSSLARDYPVQPVPFTQVKLNDEFWAPRLETNRTKSIPYAFRMNEETGRVDNFRKAARLIPGPHMGKRYNDSDIFKSMEAAAFTLLQVRDLELEKKLDELIELIGKAQEPDGYFYTARTIDPANPAPGAGKERWSNLRVSHELYNVGHMDEAAVAHFLATGKRNFLDIALKNADLLVRTFGPGRRRGFPGHQEIEMGLAKLYRVTGKKEYLELAKFFLDERGHYFQGERYPEDDPFAVYNSEEYLQNHKPVLEQTEAVGHAVRAMYMYSGMADVAALGDYPEYVAAIDKLWENVVGRKLYLTGGVGARHSSEAFGDDYELPNASAYAETCAAIGNAFWNHRLFLLHGHAQFMDVFERILYNGLLSGVSLSGDRFFYQNPLESPGNRERSPWFEVACCPPNISRFLPSLPGYLYATKGTTLYVNLFVASQAEINLEGRRIWLKQITRYPWDGEIKIQVDAVRDLDFTLALRIPGWARDLPVPSDLYRFLDRSDQIPTIKVNGTKQPIELESGYALLTRKWRKGDQVELFLPMPIRRVVAHEKVAADRDLVALQRGPVVYCAEGVDNGDRVFDLILPDDVMLRAEFCPHLLNGVVVIKGEAIVLERKSRGKIENNLWPFMAIPYYAWANRGQTAMTVWLARRPEAIRARETSKSRDDG
ncbi:MAG: glycoside hydrolase family 127 protein [Candidatus Aminicenantales bacterium]